MPELYAVLTPRLPEMSPLIVAMIWLVLLLALCVLIYGGSMHSLVAPILAAVLVSAILLLGNSVYAFVLFPAVFWGCGWCWIW